jgi:hypothetical protein
MAYDERYTDDVDEWDDDELYADDGWRVWHVVVLIVVLIVAAALVVFVVLPALDAFLFPPPPVPPLEQPLQA